MKTHMRHIEQAIAENFIVDMSAAGRPVGYKGPRHQPTEWCDCFTEIETSLMKACRLFLKYDLQDHDDDVKMMIAYNEALNAARVAIAKATGSAA